MVSLSVIVPPISMRADALSLVNFMALDRRFMKTCRIIEVSPVPFGGLLKIRIHAQAS
jgi:hypothetical protein